MTQQFAPINSQEKLLYTMYIMIIDDLWFCVKDAYYIFGVGSTCTRIIFLHYDNISKMLVQIEKIKPFWPINGEQSNQLIVEVVLM